MATALLRSSACTATLPPPGGSGEADRLPAREVPGGAFPRMRGRIVLGETQDDVNELLRRARAGDDAAAEQLMALIYDELRHMAHQRMRGQRPGHTLQTTALINEAFLKLFGGKEQAIQDRGHLLATLATMMRSILVDHARRKKREKRPPEEKRLVLDQLVLAYEERSTDLVALGEKLEELGAKDPGLLRIVDLRFFAGLPVEEVADIVGKSKRTVERELLVARAWLKQALR